MKHEELEFWGLAPAFEPLAARLPATGPDVLEALGPPPFPKSGFPFIGFLATVYDHVASHVQAGAGTAPRS